MTEPPHSKAPLSASALFSPPNEDHSGQALLGDLPVQIFSALRTIRIYPPTNPQVQKVVNAVHFTLTRYFQEAEGQAYCSLGMVEQRMLVNGQPLPEKEQLRPQIQGLVRLFDRLEVHTITLHREISRGDCDQFLSLLARVSDSATRDGTGFKEELAGLALTGITVDAKRYVAVHEGEQVVRGSGGTGVRISDDELASYVLAAGDGAGNLTVMPLAVQELLETLSVAGGKTGESVSDLSIRLLALLEQIPEGGLEHRDNVLRDSAAVLAGLEKNRLIKLLARLPETPSAEALMRGTVAQLSTDEVSSLITQLVQRIPLPGDDGIEAEDGQDGQDSSVLLQRLRRLSEGNELGVMIDRQRDMHVLQYGSLAGLETIPPDILSRLKQVDWSAPLLISGIKELTGQSEDKGGALIQREAFAAMLDQYGKLLDDKEQEKVIESTAAALASLEDQQLGVILVQRYKGLFGEKLYEQVIARLSDEKLENIIGIIQELIQKQDAGQVDLEDPELQASFQRLVQTVRQEKIRAVVTIHEEKALAEQEDKDRRLESGIRQLQSGKFEALQDDSVVAGIADRVIELLLGNREEEADRLLEQLVLGLHQEDAKKAAAAAASFSRISSSMVRIGQFHRLAKALPALQQIASRTDLDEETVRQSNTALAELGRHYVIHGQYRKAKQVLGSMYGGRRSSTGSQLPVIAKVATLPLLEQLIADYLRDAEGHEEAGDILREFGPVSVEFLIKKLAGSESRGERKRLLTLVRKMGATAIPLLSEQLAKSNTWFVTRNTIRLLGELNALDSLDLIEPYLEHEDIRVQKEALTTISRLGGPRRKSLLQKGLNRVNEALLGHAALLLGELEDSSVVSDLAALLDRSGRLPVKFREEIQEKTCIALGRTGSRAALPALEKIETASSRLGLGGPSERVRRAAEAGARRIRLIQEKEMSSRRVQNMAQTVAKKVLKEDLLQEKETEVFQEVAAGRPAQAKTDLLHLITEYADRKDFENAERLQGRLLEIDPAALTESIRCEEIIEQAKTDTVDRGSVERWGGLTEALTTGEFTCLTNGLEQVEYAPNQIMVNQGDKNEQLFFIHQGSVKLSHRSGGKELFVKTLLAGDLAGENFFKSSFWTVTLTTLTSVKALLLRQEVLKEWESAYPELEGKLRAYYQHYDDIHVILRRKGLERRQYERYTSTRKIQAHIVDRQGKRIGQPFLGELIDISRGGVAFLVRIAKAENSRMLLGRTIETIIPVGGVEREVVLDGMVIAIQQADTSEDGYSIHVRFSNPMEEEAIQLVLG